jgi:hypothetical protein
MGRVGRVWGGRWECCTAHSLAGAELQVERQGGEVTGNVQFGALPGVHDRGNGDTEIGDGTPEIYVGNGLAVVSVLCCVAAVREASGGMVAR